MLLSIYTSVKSGVENVSIKIVYGKVCIVSCVKTFNSSGFVLQYKDQQYYSSSPEQNKQQITYYNDLTRENKLLDHILETEEMSSLKKILSPTHYRWLKMEMSELSPQEQDTLMSSLKAI